MKRIITIVTMLLMVSLVSSSLAIAANLPLRIVVNGHRIMFPDAQPFIDAQQRTQVPVRFISEALGGTIEWDGKDQKVTIQYNQKTVVLVIGKKEYEVDGVKQQMDTAAQIKEQRTFVPIRFVSEALGAKVEWDNDVRTVYIDTRTAPSEPDDGEVKEAVVHGFKVEYVEMGKNAHPVYVTESKLRVSKGSYEELGRNYALMDLGIEFDTIGADPTKATNEAEEILIQQVDSDVVESIMKYVRTKTKREDILEQKIYEDSTYKIYVVSKEYDGIGITLFYK